MISAPTAMDASPACDGHSMPAEWRAHRRSWMCWPCRFEAWGSAQALARAKGAVAQVARAIAEFEPVMMAARSQDAGDAAQLCGSAVEIFAAPLDDSWARDTGPTFLSSRAGVAWRFNAWGGKYQGFENDKMFAARVLDRANARCYPAPIVCEGGAIHVDGDGTLITTEQCLLNPNRNPESCRDAVEKVLMRYTGARRVIWLGGVFSDIETDGHVDNIACFAAPGRMILGVPPTKSHPDFEPVAAVRRQLAEIRDARGRALEIVEIAQPQIPRTDWRGRLLAASYVNFYLVNGALVMPAFGDPADEQARAVLADCFPDRRIVQIEARDLVEGGGGIHCITQQEPA
jgi:agmatine deiminase